MWEVWLYLPNASHQFVDRFYRRNEAEAYKQSFLKLLGSSYTAIVCFNQELLEVS